MRRKDRIQIRRTIIACILIVCLCVVSIQILPVYAGIKIPAKVTVISVKSNSAGKVTIKWKKTSWAKGYQIVYATNSKFKKAKIAKTNSKTLSKMLKLTQGKKYYIRIRAYNKSKKTDKYGPWSKAKSVTVKKAISSAKKPTLTVTRTSKGLKASWSKVSGANKYQVVFSKNRDFSDKGISKEVAGRSIVVKVGKNSLRCGKKYYVRVRAKTGNKYEAWSPVKKATAPGKHTYAVKRTTRALMGTDLENHMLSKVTKYERESPRF